MVAFNVAGGLKTLRDKARVSLMKAGGGPICEVVNMADRRPPTDL